MSDDYAPREPVRDGLWAPFGNAVGALLLLVSMPLFIYFAFSVPEPGYQTTEQQAGPAEEVL